MQELIRMVERKEIVIVERPVVDVQMGGALAYAEDETMEEFLEYLGNALKPLEAMGVKAGDIEIITDGSRIAAQMKIGR